MADLNAQTISGAGAALTFNVCASGGDTAPLDAKTQIIFRNANAATRTVTATWTIDSASVTRQYTVPASSNGFGIFFDPAIYADATGRVSLTYSTEVDLSVAIVRHN